MSAPVMRYHSVPGYWPSRVSSVSTVKLAPPRVISMSETFSLGWAAATRRHMASRSSAAAMSAFSLCGGTKVGTSSTSSSLSRRANCSASCTCPS